MVVWSLNVTKIETTSAQLVLCVRRLVPMGTHQDCFRMVTNPETGKKKKQLLDCEYDLGDCMFYELGKCLQLLMQLSLQMI